MDSKESKSENEKSKNYQNILGIVIIIGSFIWNISINFYKYPKIYFLFFTLAVLAAVVLALISLNSIKVMRKGRLLFGSIFIGVLILSLYGCVYVVKTEEEKKNIEVSLENKVIDYLSGNTILIIGKTYQDRKEEYIQGGTEFRYLLVKYDEKEGTKNVVRRLEPKKIVRVSDLTPGDYQVLLDFFGITLDRTDVLKVNVNQCQIVNLRSPESVIPVIFKLVNLKGDPLPDLFVEIQSMENIPIRGGKDFSITNRDGATPRPLWIWPIPFVDGGFYWAVIKKGDKSKDLKDWEEIYRHKFTISGQPSAYKNYIVEIKMPNDIL